LRLSASRRQAGRGFPPLKKSGRTLMFDILEKPARLTRNQWKIMVAAILGDMLNFFDYFLIGYALAFIVGDWHLTYGRSAIILLAAGVGAVPGAFFWGWMADRIGRRSIAEIDSALAKEPALTGVVQRPALPG
jgi:predicted MFS family arabinose efflux permease